MAWKHVTGLADSNEQKQAYIKALLRERGFAVNKGDHDEVTQIDKELQRMGHEAATPEKRAEKRPAQKRTESR